MVVVIQLKKGGNDMEINIVKKDDDCVIYYSGKELTIENNKVRNTEIYEIFKDVSIEDIRSITFSDIDDTLTEAEKNFLNEIIDILKKIRDKIIESE